MKLHIEATYELGGRAFPVEIDWIDGVYKFSNEVVEYVVRDEWAQLESVVLYPGKVVHGEEMFTDPNAFFTLVLNTFQGVSRPKNLPALPGVPEDAVS